MKSDLSSTDNEIERPAVRVRLSPATCRKAAELARPNERLGDFLARLVADYARPKAVLGDPFAGLAARLDALELVNYTNGQLLMELYNYLVQMDELSHLRIARLARQMAVYAARVNGRAEGGQR